MPRRPDDRGSLSIFVVVLAPAILALAGLVIDGGGALVAKQRAADQAEQAARAGANAINIEQLRSPAGNRWIACADAGPLVDAYFARSRADSYSVVACDVTSITVSVTVKYESIILGQVFSMTQDATASPICGTDQLCAAQAQSAGQQPSPLHEAQ